MQSCDGVVANDETAVIRALQFSVTGVGTEAITTVFKKAQTPFPVALFQCSVGACAANGSKRFARSETRSTCQRRQMLQQHV